MSPRVVVVGGGLAGITAALGGAAAGYRVELFEARPRLGGLTYSFARGGLWVDNGQHVFLRCCTRYRALLARLGVDGSVALQSRLDIPVHGPDTQARLRRLPLPAPLHLGWALLRYPWLSAGARARFVRAALALRAVDVADPRSDEIGFGEWLRAHGQDRAAIESLWELVGIATLNARADDVSLALAATVFQIGLLTRSDAADIGWSRVPLQQLHGDAAEKALAAAGVRVTTRAKATALRRGASGWTVSFGDGEIGADAVILAVPHDAATALLPAGAVDLPSDWAAALGHSPIVNVHVVYDRPVMTEPFRAGIGTAAQWVFDRTEASGLRSSSRSQYLAVSVSAADEFIDVPTAELRQRFLPALHRLIPATRTAEVLDFFVTRERQATFRPAPGTARLRPPARTSIPGLHLAGAWTDTGWPATMEGAVRSGETAVAQLISTDRGTPASTPISEVVR
ncbi:hydroxysqualene dehydroxylase HpnE [Nocardia transvalensis]|uniref:hydroxysqualene dehydroxylase HpnE n=1 Tax=Nocardia transvalensis TaxID=37333 RepID=UPI0018960D25|nr:hydroxysqualene dehydroxylase HpnE [Nocardia transvalensis]MBF6330754.1 FAD-dependent oxidoreductase [Nocardia transvalensis]